MFVYLSLESLQILSWFEELIRKFYFLGTGSMSQIWSKACYIISMGSVSQNWKLGLESMYVGVGYVCLCLSHACIHK